MSVHMAQDRNPLLIPAPGESVRQQGCPACHSDQYQGRNLGGQIRWTCGACKNVWFGGIGQQPEDPTIPKPPTDPNDKPTIDFVRDRQGNAVEVRRRVNPTPEFKKGLPIPEGEE